MKKSVFLAFLLSFSVFAREWETIYIPDANCGDGIPYKVFFKPGKKSKLAIELMGGGACWGFTSCWGPILNTWIHPIPSLPAFSYLTTETSPIQDHTFIYFPYCTGDVYAGNHVAKYIPLKNTYHQGGRNIGLTLDHLKAIKKIDFKKPESLVLYGSSAGGIGALLHRNKFESYMRPGIKKLLIADSVGLHYAKDFWKKFTPELLIDFTAAFAPVGIKVDKNEGMVAPQFKRYCQLAGDWNIGFIQTTEDIIMSKMFGGLTQEQHRKAVLGPKGIGNVLKDSANCTTHISEGQGHMLLILPDVARDSLDIDTGESAMDYVDRLITESEI